MVNYCMAYAITDPNFDSGSWKVKVRKWKFESEGSKVEVGKKGEIGVGIWDTVGIQEGEH